MPIVKSIVEIVSFLSDALTVVASGIAIYLFWSNRTRIQVALQMLLNYSFQATLSELKEKLERLNEYNANEPTEVPKIQNILHEILGQIRGNARLAEPLGAVAEKIEAVADGKKLTEPKKRSLVSELREQIRGLQISETGELVRKE